MPMRCIARVVSVIVDIAWRGSSGRQFDRVPVRRVEVGAMPFLLASPLVVRVRKAKCRDDPLERGEELAMIRVIGMLAGSLRSGGDLRAEYPHPLVPFKPPLPVQQHYQGECLRLPRLPERRRIRIAPERYRSGLAQRPLRQSARSR